MPTGPPYVCATRIRKGEADGPLVRLTTVLSRSLSARSCGAGLLAARKDTVDETEWSEGTIKVRERVRYPCQIKRPSRK